MSKFPNSPGIRWMVFADVWMSFCPLQVMWLQCRSHDSDHSHVIGDLGPIRSHDQEESDATSPWILALDTSSKSQSQNQNGR